MRNDVAPSVVHDEPDRAMFGAGVDVDGVMTSCGDSEVDLCPGSVPVVAQSLTVRIHTPDIPGEVEGDADQRTVGGYLLVFAGIGIVGE